MFDIITIGSATIDAFAETDRKYCVKGYYSYPVGAKIELKSLDFHIGGSAANAAVSFARLGFRTALIGSIGEGSNSQRILSAMRKEGVDCTMVNRRGKRTGFSVVLDAKGKDRTILSFKGSNDNISVRDLDFSKIKKTQWAYSSSLTGKAFPILNRLFSFASKNNIRTALSISMRLASLGSRKLNPLLSNTDIIVYNKEEAEALTKKKGMNTLLASTQSLLKEGGIAVITDGANGAFAYDGKTTYNAFPHKVKIRETTGAGDAFASTFTAMIAKGKDIPFAMSAAIINSESVIAHLGAQNKLLTWKEISGRINNPLYKVRVVKTNAGKQ